MKKTKCVDCSGRLYVPRKNMKVRCYDCELEFRGVDEIGYFPTGLSEGPKGYFEVPHDS